MIGIEWPRRWIQRGAKKGKAEGDGIEEDKVRVKRIVKVRD